MPTHAPRPACLRWILATCLGACVGTPTPEPPDNLPRPDETRIFGPRLVIAVDVHEVAATIPIVGNAGAVSPDSELWVLNLDRSEPPLTVPVRADGSFRAQVTGQANDRVRLVARTDGRHSPPLDARVIEVDSNQLAIAQLPFEGLPCLVITPDELTGIVRAGKDVDLQFKIENACAATVSIEARLRLGDAGFSIGEVPVGATSISVHMTGHDDAREHADVLLLDVESGAQRGRYRLGVWSVAASSLGNE